MKFGWLKARQTLSSLPMLNAIVLIGLLALGMGIPLWAQEGLSTIRGTVADSSGAVVPGATIRATEVQTGVTAREATSDEQGNFEMPGLKRGTYRVTISQTGFKTYVAEDLRLQADQIQRVDAALEVGEVTTEVNVSAAATAIETEQGKIAADFSGKTYQEFPLPANAFSGTYGVLAVMPNVQRESGDWGTPMLAGQSQSQMAQDGIKEETLNSQTVNMEAVEELKLVSVNNTAEYARPGYFDTITKSGNNEFHGLASYYHRNSALGARSYFEPEKTFDLYHTFNLSASGPIIKNKTFFYALWNGERIPGSSFKVTTVPTQQFRNGDFSQLLDVSSPITITDPLTGEPFPNNVIPQNRLSGVTQQVQDEFLPLPNLGAAGALSRNFSWVHPYPGDQYYADVFSVRVDHNFNSKNSMYGRIQSYLPRYVLSGNYPASVWTRTRQSYSWVLRDTQVFSPALINTVTFGGNRDRYVDGEQVDGVQPGSGADIVNQLGLTGVNPQGLSTPQGSPVFNIDGYSSIQIRPGGISIPGKNFTFADSLSWATGKHVVKIGGELRTYRDLNGQVPNDNYGNYSFNGSMTGYGYADFMLGIPYQSSRLDPFVNRVRTSKELGMFITDTYKLTSRLTLDIGLRWDRFSAATYDDGLMFNWNPGSGDVVVPSGATSSVSPLYPANINVVSGQAVPNPDNNNFVPRVAFAYRITDKMVVRGGYGIFNEFLGPFSRLNSGGPFSITETYFNDIQNGAPLFALPDGFPAGLNPEEVPSQSVTGYPLDTKNGKIHQFNVTLERQIGDFGIRTSYIGSRNRGMNYNVSINKPAASLIPFSADRRPYSQFVNLTFPRNDGKENYDSLSAEVNRRVGLVTLNAHWTWAHQMSTMLNTEDPQNTQLWNREFTAKHRFVFNAIWRLPFGHGMPYLSNVSHGVDRVVGGWRIAWVTYLQTGQYFTPSFSGADPSNTNSFGGQPDRICDGNLPTGERTIDHWFDTGCFVAPPAGRFGNSGVNVLEGPGLNVHNMTVVKEVALTERTSFDLMWLVSNVFNHPNFLYPSANISVPGSAGVISSVPGSFDAEKAGPRLMEIRVRLRW